jgi:hypothetical protein
MNTDMELMGDGLWQLCRCCGDCFVMADSMSTVEVGHHAHGFSIIDGHGAEVYFACTCGAQWALITPNVLEAP